MEHIERAQKVLSKLHYLDLSFHIIELENDKIEKQTMREGPIQRISDMKVQTRNEKLVKKMIQFPFRLMVFTLH